MSCARAACLCLLGLAISGCEVPGAEEGAPAGTAGTVAEGADTMETYRALEQIDVQWEEAANAGDAAAIAALYTEDGTLLPPNAEIAEGREEIQAVLQAYIDAGMTNVDFTRVKAGASGDLAYEVGRYSLDVPGPGGDLVTDRGKYVIVARRQPDGSWRLVTDIFNSSQPPAASQE